MILTDKQTAAFKAENEAYNGIFLKQNFGYKFFKADVSETGNIIVFESPIDMGMLNLPNSLVICGELFNANAFTGVTFCRLYMTQIGSILSQFTNNNWYLNSDCLFMEETQSSLSFVNEVKNSACFHIIIPLEKNNLNLEPLPTEHITTIQEHLVTSFNFLVKDICLQTHRDNI